MPRPRTGSIESYDWKDGRTVTWRLRVRDRGRRHRIDLGTNHEGWNADRARAELERIMGQIERGTWRPPRVATGPGPLRDRSPDRLALVAAKGGELRPNAQSRLPLASRLRPRGARPRSDRRDRREADRRVPPDARWPRTLAALREHGPQSPRPSTRRRSRVRAPRHESGARQAPATAGCQAAALVPRAGHGGRPPRRGRRVGGVGSRAPALRPTGAAGAALPCRPADQRGDCGRPRRLRSCRGPVADPGGEDRCR